MEDAILRWARGQRKAWAREMEMLSSRKKTTSDLRQGKIVDTTEETLADRSVRLSELDTLIARHKARKA